MLSNLDDSEDFRFASWCTKALDLLEIINQSLVISFINVVDMPYCSLTI